MGVIPFEQRYRPGADAATLPAMERLILDPGQRKPDYDATVSIDTGQRAALAQQIQDWQRPLEFADHAWTVIRFIKSRLLLVALPLGLLAYRRSRLMLRGFNRGWLVKAILQKLFIR